MKDSATAPPAVKSPHSAALLLKCIDFISDTMLITEALPVEAPGPRIVYVNRAFERMTGYSSDEVIGRDPRFLQGPQTDRAELQRIREALDHWQHVRAELVNYRKNGESFYVEMDIVPICDDNGRWTHWVSIQRDVTERKKAEADALAREAQRYESLGTLSYGIAHDFNNIIAAILGNVSIATIDMQSGQMPHDSLDQIGKAALRARAVVAKILAYARRRSDVVVPLQLEPIVREASDLLRAILPANVRLDVVCPSEPLWVRGDASELCQVLLNLGVNGLQALEGHEGRIRFLLTSATNASASSASVATIEVSDSGCGMDAATQGRIFEPYFTTKQAGRGTGLGLAVVSGIVTAHGGLLAVESELGEGSCITVTLPLIDDMPAPAAQPPADGPAPAKPGAIGNGEHVLVVDDDEVVVVMLEGMLKRWGFRVTSLQDPLQAVQLVKRAPHEVDAVVTDLNMPQLSGLQLAEEVLQIRKDMPVVLGSGNVSDDLLRAASRVGIAAVFPKEFAVEQLGSLIAGALGRSATRKSPTSERRTLIPPERDARMHNFLTNNRDELIERCKAKVAQRPLRLMTAAQAAEGVPLFLDQLIRTLHAENVGDWDAGLEISGPAGGSAERRSQIGIGATAHGKRLLEMGYTVDQVVHDYGDLCQAITDLAIERDAPFSIDAYRTLNRCLDNAIADAVTEFAAQRDEVVSAGHATGENQRLGFLAHELRNYLHVALLALDALETGKLPVAGSTGAMLKHNLKRLDTVIGQTLADVRRVGHTTDAPQSFSVESFIAEAKDIAMLHANKVGCSLFVPPVDPDLMLQGHRSLLLDALNNLLQNAFKFTHPNTEVVLHGWCSAGRILIDVRDHCGGLPPGAAEKLFVPFKQATDDKRGLGLGLAIATQTVKTHGGSLSVRDIPGSGCVFTMDLPASPVPPDAGAKPHPT